MKILVVEDDFVSRVVLQEFLAPYGECHLATNGREGVEAVRRMLDGGEAYGLICLDIMMPGMDGQEALRQIRELEHQRGIGGSDTAKIVMTTALSDAKNIMTALVRGSSDGYLTKPLDLGKMKKLLADLGVRPLGAGQSPPA